jgi:hypothetical protein
MASAWDLWNMIWQHETPTVSRQGYTEYRFKPHEKASILNLNKKALVSKSRVIVRLKKVFVKCLEI